LTKKDDLGLKNGIAVRRNRNYMGGRSKELSELFWRSFLPKMLIFCGFSTENQTVFSSEKG